MEDIAHTLFRLLGVSVSTLPKRTFHHRIDVVSLVMIEIAFPLIIIEDSNGKSVSIAAIDIVEKILGTVDGIEGAGLTEIVGERVVMIAVNNFRTSIEILVVVECSASTTMEFVDRDDNNFHGCPFVEQIEQGSSRISYR